MKGYKKGVTKRDIRTVKHHALKERVGHIMNEVKKERVSYGELHELGKYKKHILKSGDVAAAEAAGIPEEEFNKHRK